MLMQTQCLPDIVNKCQLEDHLASFVPKRGFVVHHQLRVNPAERKSLKIQDFQWIFKIETWLLAALARKPEKRLGEVKNLRSPGQCPVSVAGN